MKTYEEIITLAAKFDWMLRSKLPQRYMPEVFGVTHTEDPVLEQRLLDTSHCGGLSRLLETLPKEHTDSMIRYITRKMK